MKELYLITFNISLCLKVRFCFFEYRMSLYKEIDRSTSMETSGEYLVLTLNSQIAALLLG